MDSGTSRLAEARAAYEAMYQHLRENGAASWPHPHPVDVVGAWVVVEAQELRDEGAASSARRIAAWLERQADSVRDGAPLPWVSVVGGHGDMDERTARFVLRTAAMAIRGGIGLKEEA